MDFDRVEARVLAPIARDGDDEREDDRLDENDEMADDTDSVSSTSI